TLLPYTTLFRSTALQHPLIDLLRNLENSAYFENRKHAAVASHRILLLVYAQRWYIVQPHEQLLPRRESYPDEPSWSWECVEGRLRCGLFRSEEHTSELQSRFDL